MSQKSSLLQPAKSVSWVLTLDNRRSLPNIPFISFSRSAMTMQRRGVCPPSALMGQIGWVEEGRISGSS